MAYTDHYTGKEDGRFNQGAASSGDHVKSIYDELGAAPSTKLVPAGGGTNEVLTKINGDDHNVMWAVAPGAGSGFPLTGVIDVESTWSGEANDDAKLAAAIAYVDGLAEGVVKPVLYLEARVWNFTQSHTITFNGLRISGADVIGHTEQHRQNTPYATEVNVNTGSTPWFVFEAPDGTHPSGKNPDNTSGPNQSHANYFGNMSIQCGGTTQTLWGSESDSGGVWWTTVWENISVTEAYGVWGNPAQKILMTACVIKGYINLNNLRGCALNVGGSDNIFFADGGLIDSNATTTTFVADPPTGRYHIRLSWASKNVIGPIYMTCQRMSGILSQGSLHSTTEGMNVITGARIEGRNSGEPCNGALIRHEGGGLTLRDCWLGYAMSNPSSGSNTGDLGVVHHTGGNLLMDGCAYGKGAQGTGDTVVYTSCSNSYETARVNNMMTAENIDSWGGAKPEFRVLGSGTAAIDGWDARSGSIPTAAELSCDVVTT